MPKSVIVVGGSLAGLMHGLQLKRDGHDVIILEREIVSDRSSHVAGVGYKNAVADFLKRHDDTGLNGCFISDDLHFAYRRWANVYNAKLKYQLTSWGLLYRILRANFDGFASAACPKPPPSRAGDGKAVYLVGKYVNDIKYTDDTLTVYYSDIVSGKAESRVADLVIGADGVHSTVRDIVNPEATKEYSGYVSWRGTVQERELSKATADYFINGISFNLIRRSYIVCYVIPTDDGGFEPGDRLVNWVWYYNVAEGSPEIKEIFTDSHGRLHGNTVAQGMVSEATWERVRAAGVSHVAAPFAELLNKTKQPFVTKVNDILCTTASYLDGRVLLVGDALATFRPHVALATEQAAHHSLWLGDALKGDITMEEWQSLVSVFAKRFWLLSRLVGELGQGSIFTFARSVFNYLGFMVRVKARL